MTLMLLSALSPVLKFFTGRRQKDFHNLGLCYSFLPRVEFLFPQSSVLRSFAFFLNWGFSPVENSQEFSDFVSGLPPAQQEYPLGAFHYYRLLKKGEPDSKDILEVGCGKGAGCKFVLASFFSPENYVGLDLSPCLIEICRTHQLDQHFQFLVGSATALPFSDNAFDLVFNVESSHSYPSFRAFLKEVKRVLRPGGKFLFTDLRWGGGNDIGKSLERQLRSTGMELVEFDEITERVAAARKLVSQQKTLMDQLVFRYNQPIAAHYCLEGSSTFEMLQNGTVQYFEAILKKKEFPEGTDECL